MQGQAAAAVVVADVGMLQGLSHIRLAGLGLGCFDVPKVHM
jgi:hypothetical protein